MADDAAAIDWEEVSRLFVTGRHPDDCRLRWTNCRDPRLRQGPFTEEEDVHLQDAVIDHGGRDWEAIALQVSQGGRARTGVRTNGGECTEHTASEAGVRSAAQCAGRYQMHLNPHLIKTTWTKEEDETLRQFVARHGVGRWSEAALLLPGHTNHQALHRWEKVLRPERRRGRWSKEEDDALRFAVAALAHTKAGTSGEGSSGTPRDKAGLGAGRGNVVLPWSKIAAHVKTRTDVQCRERWTNVLDPNVAALAKLTWTAEDDKELLAAVEEFTLVPAPEDDGGEGVTTYVSWSSVARRMGKGLQGKICRNRHRILLRQERDRFAAATTAHKNAAAVAKNTESTAVTGGKEEAVAGEKTATGTKSKASKVKARSKKATDRSPHSDDSQAAENTDKAAAGVGVGKSASKQRAEAKGRGSGGGRNRATSAAASKTREGPGSKTAPAGQDDAPPAKRTRRGAARAAQSTE